MSGAQRIWPVTSVESPLLDEDMSSTGQAAGGEEEVEVHPLMMAIRRDMVSLIDTPLSNEQLLSPAVAFSIIRPLEDKYFEYDNQAIIFALLLNRVQFISDQSHALSFYSVNATRSQLCELLATNLLRRIHDYDLLRRWGSSTLHGSDPEVDAACLLKSANLLVTAYSPFQGADPDAIASLQLIWGEVDVLGMRTNAVEMAIIGEAKHFIRSPPCQQVIDGIWTGRIVYSSSSLLDIIPDIYKKRPVSIYRPHNAPLLNHYRLNVPRIRTGLQQCHYMILIVSYVAMLQNRDMQRINAWELWFIIYMIGFFLEKVATILEHGWSVFVSNLWNGLDSVFLLIYSTYLVLRIIGLRQNHNSPPDYNSWANEQSHQVLACGAILIFPRLAFNILSNNLLVLSLRAMLSDFVFLMCLAVWCFVGFGYTLWLLGEGAYSPGTIALYMTYMFWGLDGTGFAEANTFHPLLGPAIFFVYASLSNTLLVTVMVSILSKIFTDISVDATAETLYRRTVLTFEGVKSDAIFNYQPPINILALFVLVPMRFFLSPRKFHSVHVFCTRVVNAPLLLLISWYERRTFIASMVSRQTTHGRMSSRISKNLRKFGAHAMVRAAFEMGTDVEDDVVDDAFEEEEDEVYLRSTVDRRFSQGTIRGDRNVGSEAQGTLRSKKVGNKKPSALARLFAPPQNFFSSHRHQREAKEVPTGTSSPMAELSASRNVDDEDEGSGFTVLQTKPSRHLTLDKFSPSRPVHTLERKVSSSRPASIIQQDGPLDADYIASMDERLQKMETNARARMDRILEGQKKIEELLMKTSFGTVKQKPTGLDS